MKYAKIRTSVFYFAMGLASSGLFVKNRDVSLSILITFMALALVWSTLSLLEMRKIRKDRKALRDRHKCQDIPPLIMGDCKPLTTDERFIKYIP